MKKILILFLSIIFLSILISGVYATSDRMAGFNLSSSCDAYTISGSGVYQSFRVGGYYNSPNLDNWINEDFAVDKITISSCGYPNGDIIQVSLLNFSDNSLINNCIVNITSDFSSVNTMNITMPSNCNLYKNQTYFIALEFFNTDNFYIYEQLTGNYSDTLGMNLESPLGNIQPLDNMNFQIWSNSANPSPSPEQKSFIVDIADYFSMIFPDSSSLTTTEKFSFVFITIFLCSLLIYFLAWKSTNKINGIVHFIVLLIDIILFFLFTAIGYIPIGIIIVIVLILLVAGIFRFKSGGN